MQGAADAIRSGINIYTHFAGLEELRSAIAVKQKRFTGMELDPDSNIIVSAGATGAMYCAFQALLNPGDEVIVFEPYYGYHVSTLAAVEARPVFVSLHPPGWEFTERVLEHAVTPRTRAILVNTPSNPSGKVFSRRELEIIAGVAEQYDLFVFTDEIYEHFLYDGLSHCSIASLPGMNRRTITVSGSSKTFSVTGWRIGYAMCDARWAQAIGYFNDLVYVCAPAPLQMGVAHGLEALDRDFYTAMSLEYAARRDKFCRFLETAGLHPYVPQGAYYVLADAGWLPGKTAKDRAMYILAKTGVASVPGSAFYHAGGGENLVRFCFAKEDHILETAGEYLQKLR
jgi:aminotransferase